MLTNAVVTSILLVHLGVLLVAAAYYTVMAAMLPGITAQGRERFSQRPWLAVVVGVVVSAPWVGASLVLLNLPHPLLKLTGGVFAGLWILCGLAGGASLAQHVGSMSSSERPTWAHTARGGLFLALTWALPIIGWLFVLPMTIATGVGCFLTGLVPAARSSTAGAIGVITDATT